MKARAVRLHGINDLRLEDIELPAIKENEVLVKIITDSICMSTYKEAVQGALHKRVPNDVAENPVIVGHEFAGEIVEVGSDWKDKYKVGQHFSVQPNINYLGKGYAPGYSFPYCGGASTYAILPSIIMEKNCLLTYDGAGFYAASLSEPVSCILAGFKSFYHSNNDTPYVHKMGIVEGGKMAMLAACGPMGLETIDIALHGYKRPSLLAVTDISQERLDYAAKIFSEEDAKKNGIELHYVNTMKHDNPTGYMRELTDDTGFDDVFAFAPIKPVVEMADQIMGGNGCLNFFAGPTDKTFSAYLNYYNIHYLGTHIIGTSGGNLEDMQDSLELNSKGRINPACMVTHIVGLDHVTETTLNLPNISGGKKLSYTHISLPCTAIADFEKLGETDSKFKELDRLCKTYAGLWNAEAEKYLLENFTA